MARGAGALEKLASEFSGVATMVADATLPETPGLILRAMNARRPRRVGGSYPADALLLRIELGEVFRQLERGRESLALVLQGRHRWARRLLRVMLAI